MENRQTPCWPPAPESGPWRPVTPDTGAGAKHGATNLGDHALMLHRHHLHGAGEIGDAEKHDANNTAMAIRVLPALSASGFSNAETPLLMASVPVIAAHPEAKARKMRNTVKGAVPAASAGSAGWAVDQGYQSIIGQSQRL